MNNILNEYFRFNFELNIELNHFSARFNVKMNNQNVSATPTPPTRGQCDLFFPRLLFLKLQTMEMAKINPQYVGMSPSPQSGLVALSSGCKLKRAKGADEDK